MSPNGSKFLPPLVYCVVAAGLLASLVALALCSRGGPSAAELSVLVAGGLALLLLGWLPFGHRRALREAGRADAERLGRARAAADLHMRAVESLAIAIDAKDQTTHGHVRRTQVYALELGRLLNVSAEELEALRAGALLHDVGNLAVPVYILNKPGRLTPAEFEKMKVHTTVGGDVVRRVGFPYPVEDVVRYHHERWDGTGYPRGLKGERIPLVARIISAVDFYDSTRCERPYRAGMTRDESLALLRRMAGKSFDPVVVETFVRHVDDFDALLSPEDLREQVQASAASADAEAASAAAASAAPPRDGSEGFRSIARAQREVAALHEMAQLIGSSLNLQDTAALVAAKLGSIVPFDACVIYAVEESSGRAAPVFAAGEWAEFLSARGVSVGEGITGWVIANARGMHNTPPELELAGAPAEVASEVADVISAPLAREEGAFGAVTLYSKTAGAYTAERLRLLESVCLHAAGALGNALTHERTRESALSDQLTGLPNARALRLMLEHRLAECRRYEGEVVSVLRLDVNDFRAVNEQFGHGVGDRLLAALAALIKGQLRQMDMLARFDGDEFLAVMPGASGQVARVVAERVRAAVESESFNVKTGRNAQLVVSVGTACHPADGETADDLLEAAARDLLQDRRARAHAHAPAAVVSLDTYR
ncbi:MAG TPA: HD domain-containing phosphohydrolase [Pyrinomonadaceae bacterium]|jgi:diguanylate cyclase (GGDEF)-like protein/putative nucleotidyltransferase with HDIG domain